MKARIDLPRDPESQLPAPNTQRPSSATSSRRATAGVFRRAFHSFQRRLQPPSDLTTGSSLDGAGNESTSGEGIEKREVRDLPDAWKATVVVSNGIESSDDWAKKLEGLNIGLHDSSSTASFETTHTSSKDETNTLRLKQDSRLLSWWKTKSLSVILPIQDFLGESFEDPVEEDRYQKFFWHRNKRLAIFASLFYPLEFILSLAFLPRPFDRVNVATYYILAPMFSVLLPLMVIYDLHRRLPLIYQLYLFMGTWLWSVGIWSDAIYCGFWSGPDVASNVNNTCGGKDFSGVMFSATVFPVISLYALRGSRLFFLFGAILFTGISGNTAMSRSLDWGRNCVNFVAFSVFISVISFLRDKQDRRNYQLTSQLKKQFRATQRAQAAEYKASESKRRFVAYIFHEIRVPLNTAMLSLDNLESEGVFKTAASDVEIERTALVGSLSICKQILDDTLDFSSLDAGRFRIVQRPFSLKTCVRGLTGTLKIASARRGVTFNLEWDETIDAVCGGLVIGDVMRLSQLINNLTSNAVKFCRKGGAVTLRVGLIYHSTPKPLPPALNQPQEWDPNETPYNNPHQQVVVKFEVVDAGPGIAAEDLEAARLFSPYVQTEIGRAKGGGKGTGLGLAIVRQIVTLSNGRLGLKSKVGAGSTFWFEIPFLVPNKNDQMLSPFTPSTEISLPKSSPSDLSSSPNRDEEAKHTRYSYFGIDYSSSDPLQSQAVSQDASLTPDTPGTPATPATPLSPLSPSSVDTPLARLIPEISQKPVDGLTVLCVDDDPMTRKLMSRMLSRLGHTVSVAEDGQQAVDMIMTTPPLHFDLIFLDNFMPVMTGVEALSELRQQGRTECVVGVTGNATADDQNEYLSAGLNSILIKPVMKSNLQSAINLAVKLKLEREVPS